MTALVPDVKRIAVLRANAVGDYVLTLPALWALRRAYPDAEITLLGKAWHLDFLRGRPGPVDDVVALPSLPGLTAAADAPCLDSERDRCLEALRSRAFDLALQLHGGGLFSNPFVRNLGARVTAGFKAPEALALDRNFPYVAESMDLFPRAWLLSECVGLVGAEADGAPPQLALRKSDSEELAGRLPRVRARLAVLQPGANDGRRRWDSSRFAAVGDALAENGHGVVIHGGPGEAPLVDEVARAMRAPALRMAGVLSLGGLCALLAEARILVSNDTGPAHLARALGVPTVTIYWIGNVSSYGPMSAHRHRVAASYRTHCPVCGRNCIWDNCAHRPSFVDDVSVETVLQFVQELCALDAA